MISQIAVDTLILSPHLDDAVFSLGSALCEGAFGLVQIVNVFSRSRYTLRGLGNVQEVSSLRRVEDVTAMLTLGISATYLDFPDSSIRAEYFDEAAYMDENLDPASDNIWGQILEALRGEFQAIDYTRVVVPLGVGGHIDHRIVRDCCVALVGNKNKIWFYEDGTYNRPEHMIRSLAQSMGAANYEILGRSDFKEKQRLASFYTSQMDGQLIGLLSEAFYNRGGERLWG